MTRTNAREIAVHLLYAIQITGESADEALLNRFADGYYETLGSENDLYAERPNAKQMAYIRTTVDGIRQRQEAGRN